MPERATVPQAGVPAVGNARIRRPRPRGGILAALTRNRLSLCGLVLLGLFALAAVLGPLISSYDPFKPVLVERLQSPSLAHPTGTDEVGRDLATRIAHGARYSLLMGLIAIGLAAAIGVPLGLLAGYRGGWWDLLLMRAIDVLLTLPSIVLAVGITAIPTFARLTRAVVLTLRDLEFVQAARVSGASDLRIFGQHLLPNVLPALIVQATLGIGTTILVASALGFLGLGVQPPTPEWGVMLNRGRAFITSAPHMVIFPGLAIALLVLAFNLLGDGLLDALDPRLRQLTR